MPDNQTLQYKTKEELIWWFDVAHKLAGLRGRPDFEKIYKSQAQEATRNFLTSDNHTLQSLQSFTILGDRFRRWRF